jgi:hypothetical protein
MFKKLGTALAGVAMMAGMSMATVTPAEAYRGRNVGIGIAAGIIGLGVLGAYANAREGRHYSRNECYKGPERCSWSDRHCFVNRYGDEVCRGGRYSCYRPTICD